MTDTGKQAGTQEGMGAVSYETAFRQLLIAQPQDIDQLGHVNNTVYLRWVQDVAVAHWLTVAPGEMQARVFFVVLRHEIDYRDPILEGERVIVSTWLGQARGPRFDRYMDIRKEGSPRWSARTLTTWVMKDIATGRPERVTDDIIEAFGIDPALLRGGRE